MATCGSSRRCCPSSRAVVVPAAVAATAKPNAAIAGCRQRRGHRLRRCRRTRIRCSLRRCPHLASAFTAIVDAAVTTAAAASPMQFPSTQPLRAITITTATAVFAAVTVAIAFAAAIAAAIALASAVTIAAASTDVSTAVIIIVVVVIVVVVVVFIVLVAVVASDLTAAYAAAIALASAVAAATSLTAVAVFALRRPAPCASLFWLIVVFTHPLASSRCRHQPNLSSSQVPVANGPRPFVVSPLW